MSKVRDVLEACFSNPDDTLGRSEDTVLIKIVFLLLWELGWDPVGKVMLGFEVPKERMGPDRQAAVVPDIVIADKKGTYLVGEVKHWRVDVLERHYDQIRNYQRALDAPKAFITNGHRWVIFEPQDEKPVFDESFVDCGRMVEVLRNVLGKEAVRDNTPFPHRNAYEIGLSAYRDRGMALQYNTTQIGGGSMSPTWIAESYKDPVVKEFVHELKNLVSEYSHRIGRDEGNTGLMIKDRLSGKKLIEYWPHKNMICETIRDHKKAGVPEELSNAYHAAVAKEGNTVKNPSLFVDLLRKIIEALDKK